MTWPATRTSTPTPPAGARRQVLGGNLLWLIGGAAGEPGRRPAAARAGGTVDGFASTPLASPLSAVAGDPWVGETFVD